MRGSGGSKIQRGAADRYLCLTQDLPGGRFSAQDGDEFRLEGIRRLSNPHAPLHHTAQVDVGQITDEQIDRALDALIPLL